MSIPVHNNCDMKKIKEYRQPFLRILEIHRQLQCGKHPNAITLAKKLEVSPSTIRRDLDFLRYQFDAPIKFSKQHNGFFYSETFSLHKIPQPVSRDHKILLGMMTQIIFSAVDFNDDTDNLPFFSDLANAVPRFNQNEYLEFPSQRKTSSQILLNTILGTIENRTIMLVEKSSTSCIRCQVYKVIYITGTFAAAGIESTSQEPGIWFLSKFSRAIPTRESFKRKHERMTEINSLIEKTVRGI